MSHALQHPAVPVPRRVSRNRCALLPVAAFCLALAGTPACVREEASSTGLAPVTAAATEVAPAAGLFARMDAFAASWGLRAVRAEGRSWEKKWLAALVADTGNPVRASQPVPDRPWSAVQEEAKGKSGRDLASLVQAQWSRVHLSDPEGLSRASWVAPARLAKERSGTSGDIAVAKYLTLRKLGWPADAVWVAGLAVSNGGELLVVCADDGQGGTWVLDPASGRPSVYPAGDLAAERPGFSPAFALGEGESVAFAAGAVAGGSAATVAGAGAASVSAGGGLRVTPTLAPEPGLAATAEDGLTGEPQIARDAFADPVVPMTDTGAMSLSGAQRAARGASTLPSSRDITTGRPSAAKSSEAILDLRPGMPIK